MKIKKESIREALNTVIDPELGIPITDLGFIRDISINNSHITITMTLTTPGCPLFSTIESEITNALQSHIKLSHCVHIKLTFDPPWNTDDMSERGRALLGI